MDLHHESSAALMKTCLVFLLVLTLAACASNPLKLDGVNQSVNPTMVSATSHYTGVRVAWGGLIVKTTPLPQTTQVEVLAYPIDNFGQPDQKAGSQGRFLILYKGFLEPTDYTPGRWISVVGTVGPSQPGKVGEASYNFPVIVPEQLHLWPASTGSNSQTFFHFGVGVQIH